VGVVCPGSGDDRHVLRPASVIPLADRRRTMRAAELVDTHSVREAAILGGIVRCIIAHGRYDAEFIARYAHEIIGAFKLVGVDRSPPCLTEISMILERFEEAEGKPLAQ
jgi:anaerobic selenocysteine-containing dehydrogenase